MTYNQIYEIVNNVAQQMTGGEISVVDTTTFVDFGNNVLSSDANKEAYLKTLADVITKIVCVSKEYSPNLGRMLLDPITYGAAKEMVYVDLPDAKEEATYANYQDGDELNNILIAKPKVYANIYSKFAGFEVDLTIPDETLRTAFHNEAEMGSFIGMLFTSVENSLNHKLEGLSEMTRASVIATAYEAAENDDAKTAINVYAEYMAIHPGSDLDPDTALHDKEFLRFASMLMYKTIKKMRKYSGSYNADGYNNFTRQEDLCVDVIVDYSANAQYYLESDTYHNSLVALPNYDELPYWQSADSPMDIDVQINVPGEAAGQNTKTRVTLDNVIGVIYDRSVCGMTIDNRRTKSAYSGRYELTTYYHKADIGYYVNRKENAVIFYVADND